MTSVLYYNKDRVTEPPQTWDELEAAAIGGTTAMFLGGHWQYRTLRDVMPAEEFGRWEVAELPGPQPDERATGTGGWTMAAFTAEPAKIEMCAALMCEVCMGPANEVIGDLPTWMSKGFPDGIPRSLEDAAMIDGCTRFGAFLRVVLPLSLPGLTSAFVLNAILGWSQFIIPFILISKPDLLPIAVGIFDFQGTYSQTSTQILAAASVLSIVPAIIVFLVLQRFIIGALTAGAVKG